jgi:hypothetical protein
MHEKKNYLDVALQYHKKGLRVIPTREKKAPMASSLPRSIDYYGSESTDDPNKRIWKQWIDNEQTEEEINALFAEDCLGIAMILHDGLEAIDFDLKYDLTGTLFKDYLKVVVKTGSEEIIEKIVSQTTINKGYHLVFKSEAKDKNGNYFGSQKLAERYASEEEKEENKNVKSKVLIETKGHGGYILIYPSHGYFQDKGEITDVKEISIDERAELMNIAKSFNEIVKEKPKDYSTSKLEHLASDGLTTIDDFNQKQGFVGIIEELQSHGWKLLYERGERIYFRRPGKDTGTSGDVHKGLNLFRSWTSSSNLTGVYSPYGVYAHLNHDGDFSSASRELYKKGYGDRYKPKKDQPEIYKPKIIKDADGNETEELSLIDQIKAKKYNYDDPIENIEAVLNFENKWGDKRKIGSFATVGAIVGEQKSRKTTVLSEILAAALDGRNHLNFTFDLKGKDILVVDTEQPYDRFQLVNKRVLNRAGIKANSIKYHAFNLRAQTRQERILVIDHLVRTTPNLGLVIIDGVVDICLDYMSSKESQDTVQMLMDWSDLTQAMVIGVLHLTKSGGMMRGHLGTELQNKADFVIQTTKFEGVTKVSCRESRYAEFDKFWITQTEDGTPMLCTEEGEIEEPSEFVEPENSTSFPTQEPPKVVPYNPNEGMTRPPLDDLPF